MSFSDPDIPQPPSDSPSLESPHPPESFLSPRDLENANAPEDIRVPWGGTELWLFLLFAALSYIVIDVIIAVYFLIRFRMTPEQLQNFLTTNAPFTISFEVVWSLLLLGFLALMISFYHGQRFWFSIGWRKLPWAGKALTASLLCVAAGVGLAVIVGIASAFVETNARVPMEELFQSRVNVLWLMGYGILFAPFWEETMFRGFIYPVLARKWGVRFGILVTGLLFGAMHAAQLWGGWGQIALLTFVGIVLTWVRARSGTVVASFLVHLTYNTILFSLFFVGTQGLHHLPTAH